MNVCASVAELADALNLKPLKAYKRPDLQDYEVQRFEQEQIQKTTINIELRSVKAAFNRAYKNEYIDKFSFRGQEYMFKTKPNRREFKMYELKRLLKHTEGKMIGQVIRLVYYTGMRIGELSELQWQMINFERKFIDLPIQITKGNKPLKIPISRNSYYILKFFEKILQKKQEMNPKWYKSINPLSSAMSFKKNEVWANMSRVAYRICFVKR